MPIAKKYYLIFLLTLTALIPKITYTQFFGWNSIGNGLNNGTNGVVNSIIKYNDQIIVGGFFTKAGTLSVNNIAAWNGTNWSILGAGVNDTVFALSVFNGNLIASGKFTSAGGVQANYIASWNGSSWAPLSSGTNNAVLTLTVFNGKLIAGGRFTIPGNHIASWDGNLWSQLNTGVNDDVFTTYVLSGNLYVGGKFTTAGSITVNRIAKWDSSTWSGLGTGMDNIVYALTSYGGYIVAGGSFLNVGGNVIKYLAEWNGSMWAGFSFQLDSAVYALSYFNNSLIVGGSFINAGPLFVNRICKWDGNGCQRMVTGTNDKVNFLTVIDTSLFAGGSYTTAGGDFAFHTAIWRNQVVHSVNGIVRYSDNNQIVTSGKVKTIRIDVTTREIIVIDSANIQSDGSYSISHGISDSTDVIAFPNDEFKDFVPTYYPSTTDWKLASKVFPDVNLSNINIYVYRNSLQNGANYIKGYVHLNLGYPYNQSGYPFSKDAIVYASQGNIFRKFAVSDSSQKYILDSLIPGTYTLTVVRMGYTSTTRSVLLGSTNLDTINFNLDTANIFGIQKISSKVPSNFQLYQNYPNPFNPNTTIKFDLKSHSFVILRIYNEIGQLVSTLVNEELQTGEYKVNFNASDKPSGIYFYELITGSFKETKKMILVK